MTVLVVRIVRAVLLVARGRMLVLGVHPVVLLPDRLAQRGAGRRKSLQRNRHGQQDGKQQADGSPKHRANSTPAIFSV